MGGKDVEIKEVFELQPNPKVYTINLFSSKKTRKYLFIFLCSSLIFIASSIIFYMSINKKLLFPTPPQGSFAMKIQAYENSYKLFKQKKGKELLLLWIYLFNDIKYEIHGLYKNGKTDCGGGIRTLFDYLGSNFSSNKMFKNEKIMKSHLKIIKYKDLKPWDLIVFTHFKRNGKKIEQRYHVGIIYGKSGGKLQYCDINKTTHMGIKEVRYSNINKKKGMKGLEIIGFRKIDRATWLGKLMT